MIRSGLWGLLSGVAVRTEFFTWFPLVPIDTLAA